MGERKTLCNFSISTEIHDTELPKKICKALVANVSEINPNIYYDLEVSFNKSVYKTKEFFQFPLSENAALLMQRNKEKTNGEGNHEIIYAILQTQLDSIVKEVKATGFHLASSAIIGDSTIHSHNVSVTIDEDSKSELSKSEKRNGRMLVESIMPDRQGLLDNFASDIAPALLRAVREDYLKQYEIAHHKKNLVGAKKVFDAIAKAVVSDIPDNMFSVNINTYMHIVFG